MPHFKARIPALLSNIRLGWNCLAEKNTLAYYNLAFIIYFKVEVEPVVKVVKAAINFALWFHVFWSKNNLPTDTLSTTWAQCYKTFYRGNLLPFRGHTVILCYKATFPW